MSRFQRRVGTSSRTTPPNIVAQTRRGEVVEQDEDEFESGFLRIHQSCENGVVDWNERDECDAFERCTSDDDGGETDDDGSSGVGKGRQSHGHRLVFSTKKLYGRDTELAKLESLYRNMIDASTTMPVSTSSTSPTVNSTMTTPFVASEVVFLSGYSGSGKTSLANAFVERVRGQPIADPADAGESHHADALDLIYIQGKYEEQVAAVPCKGISEAFERWFVGLSASRKEYLFNKNKSLEEELKKAVGEDVEVLVDILPNIGRFLLGKAKYKRSACPSSTVATDDPISKVRLHFVFRSLIKCICTKETPMVLFCDDLQWADPSSLDLLLSILSDSSVGHFFCILAGRSNEINDNHPLTETLTALAHVRQINMISVNGLPQASIAEFIADSLTLDPQDVAPLAKAVYQRSLGNILYTKQALDQLTRTNALYFDLVLFRWQWILTEDELKSHLSADILEMVNSKIKALPFELQQALVVAAHTRAAIDVDTLLDILNTEDNGNEITLHDNRRTAHDKYTAEGLCMLLDSAIEEGLLTRGASEMSSTSYQCVFAHDRIREAACGLVAGDKLHSLLFRIGKVLARRGVLEGVGEEWMLFTAVHLLNSVPLVYHSGEGKLGLARLNLEAAKLSFGRAAFEDALCYSEKGIAFLPGDRWEMQGLLCHEMYSTAAEASRLAGNIQQMERYVTICLTAERDRPLETKYRVYYTLANGLLYGSQDRFEEAKSILLYLLNHLGCPFPRSVAASKGKIVRKLLGLSLTKRSRTGKDPKTIEFMSDPVKKEAMKLLNKLMEVCYFTTDELRLALAIFTGLDYTYRYGLSVHSPRFAASACIILVGVLNDLRGGAMYARHALQLMNKVNHRPIEAATLLSAYSLGLHWTIGAKECVAPLKYGYEVGLITGDFENGTNCMFSMIWFLWQEGKPLPCIDSECRVFVPRMREVGNELAWTSSNALWGVIRRLMGSPNIDVALLSADNTELGGTPLVKMTLQALARIEQGYFGEYEKCADSAVKSKDTYQKNVPGAAIPPVDMALSAVSCMEMAFQTGKQEYFREAKRLRKWIADWAKQGNPNLQHWNALLDAEFAAMHGRENLAIQNFRRSVDLAIEGGYIHDAAVANERWGTYALEVLGQEKEAELRLKTAVALCIRWGALAKVQRLKDRFPLIFQSERRTGS